MKVLVYAKVYRPEYIDTLVWSGEMGAVPRIGDTIFLFDGWGGVKVDRVYWDLEENHVELSFDDGNGEYSRHAKKMEKEVLNV